jgi:hypothetical protein
MTALTAVWLSLALPARVLVFRFPSNRPIIALNSGGRDSKREANQRGGKKKGTTHGRRTLRSFPFPIPCSLFAILCSQSPASCDL